MEKERGVLRPGIWLVRQLLINTLPGTERFTGNNKDKSKHTGMSLDQPKQ